MQLYFSAHKKKNDTIRLEKVVHVEGICVFAFASTVKKVGGDYRIQTILKLLISSVIFKENLNIGTGNASCIAIFM